MADIVVCKNLGQVPLKVAYNSRVTVIPAGGQGFLDREAAIIHFGNWEARNHQRPDGTWVYDRRFELQRIKGLAGSDKDGKSALEHPEVWEARRPRVELFTPDNQRIVQVADDPDGDSLVEETKPDVAAQMRWMEAQLEALRQQLDERDAADPVMIPEDTPETAVRRRTRTPQASGVPDAAQG